MPRAFADYRATLVVDQLRAILTTAATGSPTTNATPAPVRLLRYATTLSETEARHVESAFIAHQVDAIRTATPRRPRPHYHLEQHWPPLVIVSNHLVRPPVRWGLPRGPRAAATPMSASASINPDSRRSRRS